MATITSAFALSHAAVMIRTWDRAPEQVRVQVQAGFDELTRQLQASQPDVIILIGNDHYQSFFLDNMPAFCVGIGEISKGWGEADIPSYQLGVHNELAMSLLNGLLEKEFDVAYARNLPLDHGFMTPVHVLMPDTKIPVVPIFQNCVAPPLPSMGRCLDFGKAIREVIDGWDNSLRVALVGTGGLSHEIPLEDWRTLGKGKADQAWLKFMSAGRYHADPETQQAVGDEVLRWGRLGKGRIDETFDLEILNILEHGDYVKLKEYETKEIRRRAGNGGQEIRNWATVAGIVPERVAETVFYHPVEEWLTGVAGVSFIRPSVS